MADSKPKAGPAENVGNAPGGEDLKEGAAPTGDKPPKAAAELAESLPDSTADPKSQGPEFNPTTPDGSPPPNNLPGPHGPQGVEHLQQDPSES